MNTSTIHLAVQIFVRRPSGGLLNAITTYRFGFNPQEIELKSTQQHEVVNIAKHSE